MQRKIKTLLSVQVISLLIALLVSLIFVQRATTVAVGLGGLIAIITTAMGMLLFRRLPDVISAKIFYQSMIVYEIAKWIMVSVLIIIMVNILYRSGYAYALPGLLVGFALCYLAYFLLLLLK